MGCIGDASLASAATTAAQSTSFSPAFFFRACRQRLGWALLAPGELGLLGG